MSNEHGRSHVMYDNLTTAFLLLAYVAPVIAVFAVLAGIADAIEWWRNR